MSNVRCWNCGMDFEVLSSARNKMSLAPQHIAQLLLDNMFDGERGGRVDMNVDALVNEVSGIVGEHLHELEL